MKKKNLTANEYVDGILSGNRMILSRAITLVESTRPEHQILAYEVLECCMAVPKTTVRIGITGVPGVGKSSFIETFGTKIIEEGHRVAVLAIDPSSRLNRGSILGDKTRMEQLSLNESAYIRPSAAGDSLGGVARKTRETIILCEAAGFDVIVVETVGVGQSETIVRDLTDFFLLLLLPNAGDELQGMKRGIVEMCDWLAINKCDINETAAKLARVQYKNALHLFPKKESGWLADCSVCSAKNTMGIIDIWHKISMYITFTKNNDFFYNNRKQQTLHWLNESIKQELGNAFYRNENIKNTLSAIEQDVLAGKKPVSQATNELMAIFLG
jgi:LAO/AO transport system kinase